MEYKKYVTTILQSLGIDYENKKIVIYGAGAHGQQIAALLKKMEVPVWGFCDNSQLKQGTRICGIPCYEPSVIDTSDDITVIISLYSDEKLCMELMEKYEGAVSGRDLNLFSYAPMLAGYSDFFPIGHFYSLYPDLHYLMERQSELFDKCNPIYGINFNETEQVEILRLMKELYDTLPDWKEAGTKEDTEFRYRYSNASFSPADSIALHCMLRVIKPSRVIEVGSGWSSAVTLDTNEFYMDNSIKLTFIEPYPAHLKSILKKSDHIELYESNLQQVPIEYFSQLNDGDLLFIDSTHVSKVGSDVNYIFFEILPRLNKGVYIHLHDIFYPFEYPKDWIEKGMVWNELYVLRAFLMNNTEFKIVFFQNMMEQQYKELYSEKWPLNTEIHGGSLWLQKL